ncbi:MAG: hypothetical protein HRT69_07350 [Flavobacteriaceae bacterium]|nr:hypothetical protein [Flavobacteriaceae bacterium]
MKYFIPIIFFILISCADKVTQQDLQQLNGYWDIDKVESVDKKVTKYGANSTIDFYFVNEQNEGYRKKTTLDFSGTYKTNNIKDKIVIEDKNGAFIIKTITSLDNWEEVIISLTKEKLVLKNEKGVLFYYNKHEKFNSN